jgi:hypothetical protein
MSKIDNGGSAFPVNAANLGSTGSYPPEQGMSLRDYFAAKAMQGFYQRVESGGFVRVAQLSYELADAMLKAREQ